MVLSEKTLYSLGRRCVYIFNRRKAKKEIPAWVNALDGITCLARIPSRDSVGTDFKSPLLRVPKLNCRLNRRLVLSLRLC